MGLLRWCGLYLSDGDVPGQKFTTGRFGAARFGDAPARKHHEGVGEADREVEILLHEKQRDFAFERGQHILDGRDEIGLDTLGRFVEDQKAGTRDQRPRDRELLISQRTFYRWRKRYGGLTSEA